MKRLTRFLTITLILLMIGSFAVAQMPITLPFYIRIADLVDVLTTTATDNYLLVYDAATANWGPEAITGAGGVDISGTPVDNDFAKFTDGNTIEGRNYAETLSDLSGEATDSVVFDWNMAHLGNIQRIRGCDDHNFNIYSNNLTAAATERDMIFWTLDATGNAFVEVFRLNANSTTPSFDLSMDLNASTAINLNTALATGEIGLNLYSITPTFATLAQSDAEGIAVSSDTRLGLDETLRNFIICDRGDIATDFVLSAASHVRLYLYDATPTNYSYRDFGNLVASSTFEINSTQFTNSITSDIDPGDAFTFDSDSNIELTDANAEQAWIKIDPHIEQSSTATWYGIWSDVTVDTEGDGSTGFGNKYLLLTESDTEKFSVGADSDLTGATVDFGGLYMDSINESMADSGKLDLKTVGAGVGGFGFIVAGDNEAYAFFSFTAAGVVTLISENNCNTTEDNDTTFNIFDSGTVVGLNNELGGTRTVIGYVMYIPD